MDTAAHNIAGYLSFTLHAHLPYVVNHGTWPHGMEWLHEAAAETYLPLLRLLGRLQKDGIVLNCNLSLSPILLEQLAHPSFIAEFPRYLNRKIVYAREDEAFFVQSGETQYAETARFWHRFFSQALEDFNALDGNIVSGLKRYQDAGQIEILTCAATHGYLPLLGTDESVQAQIQTAVQTHVRHLGKPPAGIWIPECGYRPAGPWQSPVTNSDGTHIIPSFDRIGVEQALAEADLNYFFVDTHLVEESHPISSPYEPDPATLTGEPPRYVDHRSLYRAWFVDGSYGDRPNAEPVTIFPRDPRTGVQVWSGEIGYPGDGAYCDFHKKRWPGGHRYWRVTGPDVDMGDKQPYFPHEAQARVQSHAAHFVQLVHDAIKDGFDDAIPPILSAPFDAELFGHWWFEGLQWLEAVARLLHHSPTRIGLISGSGYLKRFPRAGSIAMHEGSWGAGGHDQVWMNPETAWTWTHIYPAELVTRQICSEGRWRQTGLGTEIVQQLCRELLLLESSDWQFLITTGAARDYAEMRFVTHKDQWNELKAIWYAYADHGGLDDHQSSRLAAIQQRDSIFADIDPTLWCNR